MTILDEAIKHAEDVAKENRLIYDDLIEIDAKEAEACALCGQEHEQLAEWLRQLKAIKLLHKSFANAGGAFHYEVGRVLEGDYTRDEGKQNG